MYIILYVLYNVSFIIEAYVEVKKLTAPVQKDTEWLLTEVAPLGTRIPVQEIPGIPYEQLNDMSEEDSNRYVAVNVHFLFHFI